MNDCILLNSNSHDYLDAQEESSGIRTLERNAKIVLTLLEKNFDVIFHWQDNIGK